MNVAYLELENSSDTQAIQDWFDAHTTVTIFDIHIDGFNVFIFYS